MRPSSASSLGFSVKYNQSLPLGGGSLGVLYNVDSWQHTIQAFGGFDTASFNIHSDFTTLSDWFENGIGRHIQAYDSDLIMMWEGFVDTVSISVGGLQVKRGPLLNIANRADLSFSAFDFSFTPPVPGINKKTGIADRLESQRKYGLIYKLLNASGVTDAGSLQILTTYLDENSEPEITSSFSLGEGELSLGIECKGYYHWLSYPYTKFSGGFTNIHDKIIDALGAEPNGILSTDYTNIVANAAIVPWWDIDEQLAKDLIKGLVAMGDTSGLRYLFGIYEDRKAYYAAVPLTVEYQMKLRDPARRIYDKKESAVKPWQVRPGKWITFTDFLPGFIPPGDELRLDPRNLFIESVNYSAPNGLTLTGGKTTKFEQKIARYGLSGISA